MPSTHVPRIPHSIAPFILKCHIMPMRISPTKASTTWGVPILPRATKVEGSAETMPAPLRPTMEINRPIPAEIPYLRFAGTEFTRVSLNLKMERMTKIMPSMSIAVRATFHGSVMPISDTMGTTVKAK